MTSLHLSPCLLCLEKLRFENRKQRIERKKKKMGEILGASGPCGQQRFFHSSSSPGAHFRRKGWRGRDGREEVKMVVCCQLDSSSSAMRSSSNSSSSKSSSIKPSTFSSRIATDIPLYESQGILFDEYLNDRPRVFKAIFPDKRRAQRLNQEEWRIQMLPIQFLFLTVWPVIDMRLRCKSQGNDYPPGVPIDVSKVLELEILRWELQGLDSVAEPSHFSLGVRGSLYPERRGIRTRLKGQLEMNISFVLPPMLAVMPQDVLKGVAESVLKRLVENMKEKVNGSLLSDFSEFKKEKLQQKQQQLLKSTE